MVLTFEPSTTHVQKIKDEKSFGAEVHLHVSFESTLIYLKKL